MPDTPLTPAQQLARWADSLRDITAMGLQFCKNQYDIDNYQRIQAMSMEMFALATAQPQAEIEALKPTFFSKPCPVPVAEAAVIRDDGKMLFQQRADNGKWGLPGGAIEVGETAAQAAVREALEETGVEVDAITLVGVFDTHQLDPSFPVQLYPLVFLCKPTTDAVRSLKFANEVLQTGWFAEDELPDDLQLGLREFTIPAAFRVWRGGTPYFDA